MVREVRLLFVAEEIGPELPPATSAHPLAVASQSHDGVWFLTLRTETAQPDFSCSGGAGCHCVRNCKVAADRVLPGELAQGNGNATVAASLWLTNQLHSGIFHCMLVATRFRKA